MLAQRVLVGEPLVAFFLAGSFPRMMAAGQGFIGFDLLPQDQPVGMGGPPIAQGLVHLAGLLVDGDIQFDEEGMEIPQQMDIHSRGAPARQALLVVPLETVQFLQPLASRLFPALEDAQQALRGLGAVAGVLQQRLQWERLGHRRGGFARDAGSGPGHATSSVSSSRLASSSSMTGMPSRMGKARRSGLQINSRDALR